MSQERGFIHEQVYLGNEPLAPTAFMTLIIDDSGYIFIGIKGAYTNVEAYVTADEAERMAKALGNMARDLRELSND